MVHNCIYKMRRVVLVLLLLHVETTATPTSGMPWPNADQIIQAVCPTSRICNDVTGWSDQCCTPCTCGDGCDARSCCFRKNIKSHYETCLYLQSKVNNVYRFTPMEKKIWSYYVVSKVPDEGCYENKGSCNSSDTNDIYPVLSQQTGNIYFNKDCALCHGVVEVVDPSVNILCDNLGTSKVINVDEELAKLLDGDRSSFCFFNFEITSQSIMHRTCSIHAVESITTFINTTNEDNLRRQYNMSIDDIGKACISDFFSPVLHSPKKKLYPNPFCYLLGEGTHVKDACYTTSGIGIDFLMLLNPGLIGVLRVNKEGITKHQQEVCNRNTSWSLSAEYERCRPVFCPIGHVVNTNGECTFITDRFMENSRMIRWLNLILTSTSGTLLNDSTTLGNITIDYLTDVIQLPVEWDIAFWGISTGTNLTDKPVREILIIIKLDNLDYGLTKGVPSISSRLNAIVFFLNEPYVLSVYRKKLSVRDANAKTAVEVLKEPLCSIYDNMAELTFVDKDVPSCWKMMEFNPDLTTFRLIDFVPLSKLYFCEVVQLKAFEYRLEANGILFYNKIVSKYLYDNEFLIITTDNGDKTAKICLENSGFSKLDENATLKTEASKLILAVLLCTTRTTRTVCL